MDAPTISRTMLLGFETYRAFAPAGWSPRLPRGAVERIAEQLRNRHTWALLAQIAGEPAGHVALCPDLARADTVCLWQLFVRPQWWGTGLARTLHDAFMAEARERGYTAARLNTPAPHARARRFYEGCGWRPSGPPHELWDFGIPVIEYRRALDR
jgi:GNAT superfamily N-acetyltransferase